MHLHVLQHEPFEGPGLIEDWALQAGFTVTVTHLFNNEPLPTGLNFDWLVIMGGGMSVNDEATVPWLQPEKQFVRQCIAAGKTVIGICLGAQLIASALGARVYRNPQKEIGWLPVQLTAQGLAHPLFKTGWNGQTFFHWHGETFDLPPGAVHLAYSEGCKHQAFCIGNKVFAFQFHPETNAQTLHQMVSAGGEELVKATYVITAPEIDQQQHHLQKTSPLFFAWLDVLAGK